MVLRMTTNTNRPALLDFAGRYGRAWVEGVIAEHICHLEGTGAFTLRFDADGFVSVRQDDTVLPLLCGDIIEVPTEDGPISGRCGLPVHRDVVRTVASCPGHAGERARWASMSGWEQAAWEKEQDSLPR